MISMSALIGLPSLSTSELVESVPSTFNAALLLSVTFVPVSFSSSL